MNWNPFDSMQSAGGFVQPVAGGITPQAFAGGGAPSNAEEMAYASRGPKPMQHSGGLFTSAVPGRTDQLDTLVPAGAYVVPADVVSGLGQGNTMAGSAVLDKMFSTGPYGSKIPRIGRGGPGIPGAPGPYRAPRASGGKTSHVPIIAAGGEYLIPPEVVEMIGAGDINRGHKILDHFVLHARKKTTDEMRKLPGPKK